MFSHAQTQDGRASSMMGLRKEGSDGMPRALEVPGRTREAAEPIFPVITVYFGSVACHLWARFAWVRNAVTPDLLDLWVVACELR